MKTKKADFNFVWMFAIIAGSMILLLAIFGAVRYGKTISITQDTEIAKSIAVLTEPMQAGFADAKRASIRFRKDTVVDTFCNSQNFGYQMLSVKTQERPSAQFETFGEEIKVENKYLFISDDPGKDFYVLSYSIDFAYKIADVIVMDSKEYCFLGLEDEDLIRYKTDLQIIGEKAKFGQANCTDDSIRVCFGFGGNCDVLIRPKYASLQACRNVFSECRDEFEIGVVEKNGQQMEYAGNLIYPAIFSNKIDYDCNVKRLMYRKYVLSNIYIEKAEIMAARGCDTNVVLDLQQIGSKSVGFSGANSLISLEEIYLDSKALKLKEERSQCRLWTAI